MIELKKLVEAGVHFGHKTSRWSPKMREYIWGSRNGIHLIDVSKTAFLLEKAGKLIKEKAASGGQILWIGTKKSARGNIARVARELDMPSVVDRWIGGTLTNNDQVKKAVTRLLHLRDVVAKPNPRYKKKEMSMLQKEIERLERNIGGIIDLHYPPAALVIVDAKKEASAIREASYLGIPVIGIVDTNTDPAGITGLIPANDDSPRSIALILDYLADAAREGVAQRPVEEKTAKKKPATKSTPVEASSEEDEDEEEVKVEKKAPAAKKAVAAKAKAPAKSAPKAVAKSAKAEEAEEVVEKKAAAKPAAKKAPAKSAATKKPATKSAATKKPAAKAATTAKKTTTKKPASAAKASTAKKSTTAAKKKTTTTPAKKKTTTK